MSFNLWAKFVVVAMFWLGSLSLNAASPCCPKIDSACGDGIKIGVDAFREIANNVTFCAACATRPLISVMKCLSVFNPDIALSCIALCITETSRCVLGDPKDDDHCCGCGGCTRGYAERASKLRHDVRHNDRMVSVEPMRDFLEAKGDD